MLYLYTNHVIQPFRSYALLCQGETVWNKLARETFVLAQFGIIAIDSIRDRVQTNRVAVLENEIPFTWSHGPGGETVLARDVRN
jgi:hypothetical protein